MSYYRAAVISGHVDRVARLVVDRLAGRGDPIWWNQTSADLTPINSSEADALAAVDASECVVVLFSHHALEQPFFARTVEGALRREKPFLPCLIDGVAHEELKKLASSRFRLNKKFVPNTLTWFDLGQREREGFERALDQLEGAVDQLVSGSFLPAAPQIYRSSPPIGRYLFKWLPIFVVPIVADMSIRAYRAGRLGTIRDVLATFTPWQLWMASLLCIGLALVMRMLAWTLDRIAALRIKRAMKDLPKRSSIGGSS